MYVHYGFVDQSGKLCVRKTAGFYVQETSLLEETRKWEQF